jgi:fatty-acyl-CoA synthase
MHDLNALSPEAWSRMTLGQALADSARRYPDRVALADGPKRITFQDLDRQVDALALGLRAQGLGRGDQVAMWMTNCADWVVCWLACTRLGAVLVPINTRYKQEEVEYILRQSDARALILMDRFWDIDFLGMALRIAPEIAQAESGRVQCAGLPQLRHVILWRDVDEPGLINLDTVARQGAQALAQGATLPPADPKDAVIIVYTSGTTGHPKGAMHNHIVLRNVANIARVMRVVPGDVVLGHMPFYHVAGAFSELAMALLVGCTLVPLPHWVPDEALAVIEQERVTIFGGIPTHFVDCIDALRRRPRDTACLKSAWIGGAPVTPDIAMAARETMQIEALQAVYGMTETTASTTFSEHDAPLEVLCDNKGKPIGQFEVKVCDPENGQPRAVGEVGEVWVRGHLVMMGYYKDPEATAKVITPDGWFRTGDLGTYDAQGYLKITGRLKDMFIVGGSNAYPAEIERILQSHDAVKQAVVVGMPDRRLGEVAMAFVQLQDGAQLDAPALVAFCREHMADYKVPRRVHFVEDFPRTSTGKIQRFVLSEQAREAAPAASAGGRAA